MNSPRLTKLFNFLEANPDDPFLLFAVAKEYEKLEVWEQALNYYQKLSEEHESYVGTYYHLGKLYERMEQPESAWNIYKKGMEVAKSQGDQHALSELAGAKLELGDEDDFE